MSREELQKEQHMRTQYTRTEKNNSTKQNHKTDMHARATLHDAIRPIYLQLSSAMRQSS